MGMGRFGFIIHPLSVREDVARKYPIARLLPERAVEWAIKHMRPRVVSHITGVRSATGAETEGWFVGCPLSPRQFMTLPVDFVIGKVIEAGRVAQEAGAKIVGLGAFTSVVGDAGISINDALEIAVTTGNSYTVATAVQGAFQAAELMGHRTGEAVGAVVGATGSIGRVCSQMMAEVLPQLILVGLEERPLRALAEQLSAKTQVSVSLNGTSALRAADIVVTVTSAVDTVINAEDLKPGAVVCDVARPRDVSRQVAEQRQDVLVVEGGVVAVPGDVEFGFDFGFPPKTAYACMSETMILALEGRYEPFSLGRELSLERVREIAALADKHGFRLAGFRSFERAVTDADIDRARTAAAAAARVGS